MTMTAAARKPTRCTARGKDSKAHLGTPASRDPDVRLMLQVQRDEPGAFETLINRYWARIFGHFFHRLGDRQEAEDLAQDVFLRLYRHRKRYQPRAKFATWLYHIKLHRD